MFRDIKYKKRLSYVHDWNAILPITNVASSVPTHIAVNVRFKVQPTYSTKYQNVI